MAPEVKFEFTVTFLQPVAQVAVPHVGDPPGVTKQAKVIDEVIPAAGV